MVNAIIRIRGIPHYYYKTLPNWAGVQRTKNKFKKAKYFYIKTTNRRTGQTYFVLYFDRKFN